LRCQEMFRKRDEDWFDLSVRGKQIDDAIMKEYCDCYRVHETLTAFKIAFNKPIVSNTMYVILIGILPKNLRELIRTIQSSWTVVDRSARADDICGSGHGDMRAWHQNGDNMLPKLEGPSVQHQIVSDKYQAYIEEHKGLPTKQVSKGLKEKYTGYVEYTLRSWRSSQGRMVYDYYNNRFYLTPGHYGSGNKEENAFYLVQLD
jgi:hypothetical protein